ncbi:MAG: ATP-binding protein [Chloroflexi bacterium]|nr:ATP-binding protein [Chloroflexota bacterium]
MNAVTVAPASLIAITEAVGTTAYGPVKIGRFDTFVADFTSWHLSLTDSNPCVWVKASDLEAYTAVDLANALREVVRKRYWQNSKIIVFVDGSIEGLKAHLTGQLPQFVLFNQEEQNRLATDADPYELALELLRQKMPRLHLAPYETSKPVTGGRFFGRQAEVNQVIENPDSSYLFVGIRRIGKTSLLKEIKRQLDLVDPTNKGQMRRVYIDCTVISSEEEFLRTLIFQLERSGLTLLAGHARDPQRYQKRILDHYNVLHGEPITFLLDEFDRLIAHMRSEWPLLQVLRTAVLEKKIRFVAAGFRRAMDAATDVNSPFFNLMTPVRLGRLPENAVKEMVLKPMHRLGVTVEDPETVVKRINQETAGLPNYIQFYCKTLLQHLQNCEQDVIQVSDLRVVHENIAFQNFVLNTFMSNTDSLERAIVYAIIAEGEAIAKQSFTEKHIQGILKKRKLSLPFESLDKASRNLEMAGVFNRVGADYEFAVPLFQHLLRQTRDVGFLFERTKEALQTENILT